MTDYSANTVNIHQESLPLETAGAESSESTSTGDRLVVTVRVKSRRRYVHWWVPLYPGIPANLCFVGLSPVFQLYTEATPISIFWLSSSWPRPTQSKKKKDLVNKSVWSSRRTQEWVCKGILRLLILIHDSSLGFREISAPKEDSYLGRGLIMSSVSQLDVVTLGARNEEELGCIARFRQAWVCGEGVMGTWNLMTVEFEGVWRTGEGKAPPLLGRIECKTQ